MSSMKDLMSELSQKEPLKEEPIMWKSIESLLSSRNSEKLIVNIIPERDTIGGVDKENEHKNVIKEVE